MFIELPEGSPLLSYRDSGQELSLVFGNGASLIRDIVSRMGVVVRCPSMATHIRTSKCRILSFSVVLSDYSGGSWSKKANMSTVAIMVAFILL